MGYDKDKNGNLVVNEKQAKIVRRIYKEFLDGTGANRSRETWIWAAYQTGMAKPNGMKAVSGKCLPSKKYKDDALLQKTYTVDFLSKKRVDNNGQVPQYYVEDSHPAIIDKKCGKRYSLSWSAGGISR